MQIQFTQQLNFVNVESLAFFVTKMLNERNRPSFYLTHTPHTHHTHTTHTHTHTRTRTYGQNYLIHVFLLKGSSERQFRVLKMWPSLVEFTKWRAKNSRKNLTQKVAITRVKLLRVCLKHLKFSSSSFRTRFLFNCSTVWYRECIIDLGLIFVKEAR